MEQKEIRKIIEDLKIKGKYKEVIDIYGSEKSLVMELERADYNNKDKIIKQILNIIN